MKGVPYLPRKEQRVSEREKPRRFGIPRNCSFLGKARKIEFIVPLDATYLVESLDQPVLAFWSTRDRRSLCSFLYRHQLCPSSRPSRRELRASYGGRCALEVSSLPRWDDTRISSPSVTEFPYASPRSQLPAEIFRPESDPVLSRARSAQSL